MVFGDTDKRCDAIRVWGVNARYSPTAYSRGWVFAGWLAERSVGFHNAIRNAVDILIGRAPNAGV